MPPRSACSPPSPPVTMGAMSMGVGRTLTVGAEAGTPANLAYGLTFGATTLNGAATFAVANNGTGTGTVTLGPVGGAGGSITKTGPGTLALTGAGHDDGGPTAPARPLPAPRHPPHP